MTTDKMAYPYLGNLTNSTGYLLYMNTVTQGYFWTMALIGFGVAILAFLSSRSNDFPGNIHAVLFIEFMVSLPLFAMELISSYVTLIFFIFWGLSAWYLKSN